MPYSTFHYLLSHPAIDDAKVNQPRADQAPTRELAAQIHAASRSRWRKATGCTRPRLRGDGYDKQLKVLESGVDILIGTTAD